MIPGEQVLFHLLKHLRFLRAEICRLVRIGKDVVELEAAPDVLGEDLKRSLVSASFSKTEAEGFRALADFSCKERLQANTIDGLDHHIIRETKR